jgi:hypothetical protein
MLVIILVIASRPTIAAHRDAAVPVLLETAIMLGVTDAATPVVALMTLLIAAIRLLSAEAMIVLRISHPAATIVAAMTGFIEAIRLVAAQAMIVLGIPYPAATVVAAAA